MADDRFNLLEGAMPLLDIPDRPLTPAEVSMLKPILDQIHRSMCSGGGGLRHCPRLDGICGTESRQEDWVSEHQ